MLKIRSTVPLFLALAALRPVLAASLTVDFRYAPPEWQTAICLPDDPHKSLVNRNGELLYHFGQDGREFATRVGVEVIGNAVWQRQELLSPRVPIVRTFRSMDTLEILEETFAVTDFLRTDAQGVASTLRRVAAEGVSSLVPTRKDLIRPEGPPRNDVILVHVTNHGTETRTLRPQLFVDTTHKLTFEPDTQRVRVNDHETITTSLRMTGLARKQKVRQFVQLEALIVPAGQTRIFFVVYSGGGSMVLEPATVDQALAMRNLAVTYWANAQLPFDRVQVPDPGIQALLDSSIRNIWQAREIKNGLPAFQVGPTCYRGLWIVDGAFILESAAMIGAGQQARSGVAYELTFQKSDGRIEVMENFSKENGIVLWTCVRHAQLTQDKAWLESVWPRLTRVVEYIRTLRQRTLENDTPLDDGLVPPGFSDGGLAGIHAEYTNPYWNLTGLRAFVQGAHWLGKDDEAVTWQKEYDGFMAAFRKAAQRDMARDAHGHAYVPIRMGEPGRNELTQRAQWAFCHAVYPGQVFAQDDPLVASTLAMLAATEHEGMVYGTGWDPAGIWNYFASFYGHAWLWQGHGQKAAESLYAFANHAAPTGVWCEEQSLKGETFHKVGDMPHNWASAEFIRLTLHLLALDRGNELHLLEGFPRHWAGPGMTTRLSGVSTPFGPLDMTVQADQDGKVVTVKVQPLTANCRAVIVHLPNGSTSQISPQQGGTITFAMQ